MCERNRRAVEVAERFADGQGSAADLTPRAAIKSARTDLERAAFFATWDGPVSEDTVSLGVASTLASRRSDDMREAATLAHDAEHAGLVRCILGNPFRPVAADPFWLTATVVSLAQAAYDNRILPAGTLDATRLAIPADALEDAGCTNSDILSHCRSEGLHVRGCWVVDLLLGKK
jgi:hypothetical protein